MTLDFLSPFVESKILFKPLRVHSKVIDSLILPSSLWLHRIPQSPPPESMEVHAVTLIIAGEPVETPTSGKSAGLCYCKEMARLGVIQRNSKVQLSPTGADKA